MISCFYLPMTDEDFGITRIKKALGAHMWPKMRMKTQKKEAGPFQNEVRSGVFEFSTHDAAVMRWKTSLSLNN